MQSSSVATAVTDVQALGPNPLRQRLIVSAPRVGRVSLAFGQSAVLDAGITVQVGGPTLVIDRDDVGDDIESAVHLISTGAGETLGIAELSY